MATGPPSSATPRSDPFVYLPKHTSWLNQIEIWFSILVRRLLTRNFTSTDDLRARILAFIDYFNRRQTIQVDVYRQAVSRLNPTGINADVYGGLLYHVLEYYACPAIGQREQRDAPLVADAPGNRLHQPLAFAPLYRLDAMSPSDAYSGHRSGPTGLPAAPFSTFASPLLPTGKGRCARQPRMSPRPLRANGPRGGHQPAIADAADRRRRARRWPGA